MRISVLAPLSVGLVLAVGGLGLEAVLADNIALGKPYKWSTPPRYGGCADEGDTRQLTDGASYSADWTVESTVGWVHQGRVEVIIDLGSVQPIGRVVFVAAGGGLADVFFPAVTAVLTSEDGEAWYLAGAIGSGALVQDRTKEYSHSFETTELRARGRYVRLVYQAEERYLFLDEIEVHSTTAPAPERGESITADELDAVLKRGLTARWVAGEWLGFREQIEELAEAAGARAPMDIPARVEEMDARVAAMDVSDAQETQTLRKAYTELRADVAQALYGAGPHVQRVYPWGEFRGETLPVTGEGLPDSIDITLWQDEYESAAWAVTNLTHEPLRVTFRASPLTDADGREYAWEDRLWLRYGIPVPTRVGFRVVDALPLAGNRDGDVAEVDVVPGEYRLLWLSLQARDLPPGEYSAEIRLQADPSGDLLLESPLALTVAPLRMPPADERVLSAYSWEQLTGWDQPAGAAADLRAHGINTFMMHPAALPIPTFDIEAATLKSVDFAPLDAALARCEGQPRMHGVFWGGNPSFWGLDLHSADGAHMLKQFFRAWAEHLEEAGISPPDPDRDAHQGGGPSAVDLLEPR